MLSRPRKKKKSIAAASSLSLKDWETIYRAIPHPMMILDPDHTIRKVNAAARRIAGKSAAQLLGRKCHDVFHKRKTCAPGCPMQTLIRSRRPQMVVMEMEALGRAFMVTCTPILDDRGKVLKAVHMATDITDRKRAEEALQESEEKYRLLFSTANEGIVILDMKAKILDVNEGFLAMTGFSRAEITGKHAASLGRLFKIGMKQIAQRFNRFLRGELTTTEWVLTKKNGEKINILVHPSLIRKSGKKIGISTIITDMTERKRAEEKILSNERFLNDMFDAIQDGISVLDRNFTILRTNIWMNRRYAASKPLEGKKCYEVYHRRLSPCPWCPSIRTMETGEPYNEVVPFPDAGNPSEWFEMSSFPIKDQEGRTTGIIEYIKDITDRKRTEQALRESEEKYRSLIENSNDAIYLLYNRKFEIINKKFTKLLGVTMEDVNRPEFDFLQLVKPEDHPIIERRVADVSRGVPVDPQYQFRAVARDGRELILEASVAYIPYKEGKATQGVLRDVTERRTMDEKLRENENRMRVIIEGTPHLFFYTQDKRANLTYISPSVERITGHKVEEWYSRTDWFTTSNPINDLARARTHIHLRGESTEGSILVEIEHADKHPILLEIYENPVFSGGECVGIQGVAHDITDRVQAEELIKQSLKEKEVLLKEVHHRVKNNLTVINSLLNLQSSRIRTQQQAIDAFKESRDRVHAMAMVHEKLYQSGVYSEIDFKDYAESLVSSLMRIHRPKTKIDLVMELEGIRIDINRAIPCGLILNELITNALKHAFTDSAKGNLTIRFKKSADGLYELSVSDDGIGIPDDVRIEESASLGLRLINILANQLDGNFTVRGGKGTECIVKFPIR